MPLNESLNIDRHQQLNVPKQYVFIMVLLLMGVSNTFAKYFSISRTGFIGYSQEVPLHRGIR